MSSQLSSLLFLVVGISMALTPWLAAGGQFIASRFDLHDVRSLLPVESEVTYLTCNFIEVSCFIFFSTSAVCKQLKQPCHVSLNSMFCCVMR